MTKGNCEIYTGSYSGTGSTSHSLHFPKLPRLLVVQRSNATPCLGVVSSGLYMTGSNAGEISLNGTSVSIYHKDTPATNHSGFTYHYAALASV